MIYVIHWFVNILTLGLVSIATITTTTYHVDEPITELNNQTLNEVFEPFDLSSYNRCYQCSLSLNNNIKTITPSFNSSNPAYFVLTSDLNYLQYDFLYVNLNVYADENSNNATLRLAVGSSVIQQNPTIKDVVYNMSHKSQISGVAFEVQYRDYVNTQDVYHVYDVYVVNMTDLGIDNLTKNQMDDWFDIYLQANANNGVYIESTSHLNNNIHLVDVSVMVISFGLWVWLFKFLKGVIF